MALINNPPDGPAPSPAAAPAPPPPTDPYAPFYDQKPGIAAAYQKYLGRGINDTPTAGSPTGEYQSWLGNPNYEQDIANSDEAKAYAARMGGGSGSGAGTTGGNAAPPPSATGPTYGGTSVFTDPATKQFEDLLNQRIKQLQTPFTPPDYSQGINQLNDYLAQLNGPAYTPDQMDTMQTQALDPLEHQRTQAKQQAMQRLASHGISASSGIVEKAMEDIDNQFNSIRSQTQGQFATNAIQAQRQNAASAAMLAPQISALEQNQFNAQDTRDQSAVGLAQIIPDMAWSRLTGANGLIQQTNPLSALQLVNGFQNQGYNQSADFSSGLGQLLSILFGLGN